MFMLSFALGLTIIVVLLVFREIRGQELLEESASLEGVNPKKEVKRCSEIES